MAKAKKREHNDEYGYLINTFDKLLYDEKIGKNKSDALVLYYTYARHIQKENLSLLSVHNAAQLLNVSPNRIRKARKILLSLNLISPCSQQDDNGVIRHYIRVHSA